MNRAKEMETWLLGWGQSNLHTISQSHGNRCQHVWQIWQVASARCNNAQNVQAWSQSLLTSVKGVNETSCVSEDSLTGPQRCPWHPWHLQRQSVPKPVLKSSCCRVWPPCS